MSFLHKHTTPPAQTTGAPLYSNVSSTSVAPTNIIEEPVRQIVNAPIVQESVRNDRLVEVQPVIHQEVDHNVVHHIERHIHEPAAPAMGGVFEKPPLVQQTHHTSVVEEIQPIIHRERVVPVAEQVVEHRMEHVAQPTVHTHEVVHESASHYTVHQQAAPHHHGLFHRH